MANAYLYRNYHPSNRVVTFWALCFYLTYATASIAYFTLGFIFNDPFSLFVETCLGKDPRNVSSWRIIIMTMPNFFYVASLFTDILLIRFLHKTIMPMMPMKLETLGTNQMRQERSFSNSEEPKKSILNRLEQKGSCKKECQSSNLSSNQIEPDDKSTNIPVEEKSGANLSDPGPQTGNKWYQRIKCWNPMQHIQSPERIPIRVSIMSSMLIIPFVVGHIAINLFHLDAQQRTDLSWMILAITNTLRCPLIVILAFKSTTKASVRKKDDHQMGFPIKKDPDEMSDSESI